MSNPPRPSPLDIDLGRLPPAHPRTPKAATRNFAAFKREAELFDRALANPRGIQFSLTFNQAISARIKLHRYRKMLRDRSEDIFESDDPRWGSTPFDGLIVVVPPKPESGGATIVAVQIVPKAALPEIVDL